MLKHSVGAATRTGELAQRSGYSHQSVVFGWGIVSLMRS